ncbi:MAG: DUF2786 domain-containing protein [Verrucomicrobiota bacterium]
METPENILDKIRALLRLANSDNPHEAALAMERAHAIAAKHQVEIATLPPEDDLHALLGKYVLVPTRVALEWKEALNLVLNYFNVDVTLMVGSGRCLVVGTALDIELAEYVMTYLVRACRKCLADWKAVEKKARRKTSGPKVAAFVQGFFNAMRWKLHAQQRKQKAEHLGLELALSDAAKARDAFSRSMLKGKTTTLTMPTVRRDRRAGMAGYIGGASTDLNPGLRSGSTAPLALT